MFALTVVDLRCPRCHIALAVSEPGRRWSQQPPLGNQPPKQWQCLSPEARTHTPHSAHHDTTSSPQLGICSKVHRFILRDTIMYKFPSWYNFFSFQLCLSVKPLTCRWLLFQVWCHICHRWGRSQLVPRRCSDMEDHPRSGIRGHKHTRPRPTSDSPYTWKTRCMPGTCRDLPGRLCKKTRS